jgi:hypothetical protein
MNAMSFPKPSQIVQWNDSDEAKALLADCAINPPQGDFLRAYYGATRDEWFVYDIADPRVAALTKLYDAFLTDCMDRNDRGDRGARETWLASKTVTQAIDLAITTREGIAA